MERTDTENYPVTYDRNGAFFELREQISGFRGPWGYAELADAADARGDLCRYCGVRYTPYRPHQVTCAGAECQAQWTRDYQRRWAKKNYARKAESKRAYARARYYRKRDEIRAKQRAYRVRKSAGHA